MGHLLIVLSPLVGELVLPCAQDFLGYQSWILLLDTPELFESRWWAPARVRTARAHLRPRALQE